MTDRRGWTASPLTPYVLPFAVFLLLTEAARWIPGSLLWIYPVKTAAAAILLWRFRRSYRELRWEWSPLGVVVGVAVLLLWIPLSHERLLIFDAPAVDAYELAGSWAVPWIAVRLLGSALVVPVLEELFWRSFVLRCLIDSDFERVPVGTFTWPSLAIGSVLFGVEHSQWLAGIAAGLLYAWLLYRTKSLSTCIVAHAVTNGLLGAYVLLSGDWHLW